MTDEQADTAPAHQAVWPWGITPFERRFGNGVTRVVTAIVGIPVVLYSIWLGELAFVLLVAVVATGALLEFYWIAETTGARPMKLLGVAIGLGVVAVVSLTHGMPSWISGAPRHDGAADMGSALVVAVVILGTLATLVVGMFRVDGRPLRDNLLTIGGILYITLSLSTLLVLRNMFPHGYDLAEHGSTPLTALASERTGAFAVVGAMVSIWTCDTAAYVVGRAIGRHRLFERISPTKSWEGGIAGALGAVMVMLLVRESMLPYLSLADAVVLGMCSGVAGQLGDLAESHLKRDAGVKDSSQIIPGHGGLLDRFDSLLFVAPLWTLYHAIVIIPR